MSVAPLRFLMLAFAGWVNRRQVEILEYLREENRVLREQLGDQRLRFTDAQRRRLAAKGKAIGRSALEQLAGLVTPDTILRWYRELIAKRYDGTARRGCGRSGTAASMHRLVVQFATENPTSVHSRRHVPQAPCPEPKSECVFGTLRALDQSRVSRQARSPR